MSRHVTISVNRKRVGFGAILLHTVLTIVTGGFWLVILLIRALLR